MMLEFILFALLGLNAIAALILKDERAKNQVTNGFAVTFQENK